MRNIFFFKADDENKDKKDLGKAQSSKADFGPFSFFSFSFPHRCFPRVGHVLHYTGVQEELPSW